MVFDLVSVFLDLAGVLLGLMLLIGGLRTSRGIDVTCVLHDRPGGLKQ
jgi:hypothetical protein